MKSWVDYWNSTHAIYVSDRHKQLHAAAVARAILGHVPTSDATVLDYGCGEALYAEDVAVGCRRLILCEAAPAVRSSLSARVSANPRIEVVDPDAAAALLDRSIDLIVANSLVQYLSRAELDRLLVLWRRLLAPHGRLIVADVIPPNVSPLTDALALLRFARSGGFLAAAVAGLAKTAVSDYRKIRTTLGFSTYTETEFLGLLAAHKLDAERIHPNFGHNQARMAFRARPGAPNTEADAR